MEHHPIPQQISAYEFRLVGSMTLKQFLKLAVGLIIAFIIYHSGLFFLIKWPLVIASASLGAAFAFLPVNERPLEKWVVIFFQSIYSPTLYAWQKQPKKLDFADYDFGEEKSEEPEIDDEKDLQLEEFLASIEEEKEIKSKKMDFAQERTKKKKKKKRKKIIEEEPIKQESESQKDEKTVQEPPKTPEPEPIEPEPEFDLDFPDKELEATAETEFGEIPKPEPPKTPNKVVGMVFDNQGKIIENAIIEIQDKKGAAVRALRTNRLGQFETATPLSNGEYFVSLEKEGYQFDILKLEAKGKILEPLIIKAKNDDGY